MHPTHQTQLTLVPHHDCCIRMQQPSGSLCASCTSYLEQLFCIDLPPCILHCMLPSSVQRVHSCIPLFTLTLLPCHSFISQSPVKVADLPQSSFAAFPDLTAVGFFMSSTHPFRSNAHTVTLYKLLGSNPASSSFCHNLLPRPPHPFKVIRLTSTLLPHATSYSYPSLAYRT